ncbi:MAG: hypothetical protein EA402_00725 [Planctomycetota bacterium]|nr:MAG: hypothetical protein EA402_00725 [Planctomycetota bacterium]
MRLVSFSTVLCAALSAASGSALLLLALSPSLHAEEGSDEVVVANEVEVVTEGDADDAEASAETAEAEQGVEEEVAESEEEALVKAMREEIKRLSVAQELKEARMREALSEIKAEGQRIEAELAIAAQRRRAELAELEAEKERLQAQGSLEEARQQAQLRELRQQQERQALAFQLKEQELREAGLAARQRGLEREQRQSEFEFQQSQRQNELADLRFEMAQMETKVEAFRQRQEAGAIVEQPIERRSEPYVDGVLTISDRRIDLNEPIIAGTGDWISRRINYYNNDSAEDPIFLVIDYCPGGSIMDGEIILRAMKASDAPVHVVVKSMAASMAAIILGDAPHSYALPNAVIMHHQPWSYTWGNLAQQQEWVKVFRQWAERIHGPTAERMGLTIDEFYSRMYEETVSGDWSEFADKAQELGWVQHVVNEIREDNVRVKPSDKSPWHSRSQYWSAENQKEQVRLPRPRAYDFYFLFNRDGRYVIGEQ